MLGGREGAGIGRSCAGSVARVSQLLAKRHLDVPRPGHRIAARAFKARVNGPVLARPQWVGSGEAVAKPHALARHRLNCRGSDLRIGPPAQSNWARVIASFNERRPPGKRAHAPSA